MHGWQANQRAHLRYASEQGLCPKMKNHPLCGWMIIKGEIFMFDFVDEQWVFSDTE